MEKRRTFGIYDLPLFRDPLFWWTLVIAGIAVSRAGTDHTRPVAGGPAGLTSEFVFSSAFLFDAAFMVVIFWVMWCFTVGMLRRNLRAKRERLLP